MQPLLSLQDISYAYHNLKGETPALSHISMDIFPGEFLAIVGPSGCGKSTLLSVIAGLLAPESGSIYCRANSSRRRRPADPSRSAICCSATICLNGAASIGT